MSAGLLTISGLSFSYGAGGPPALDRLSATVRTGRITGLVGPDGAGTSPLIRLLTGLLLPTAGTITVFGLDSRRHAPAIQQLVGYMPQKFGLYEELSVQQNLTLYADLQGVAPAERPELYARLLAFTGLEPFRQRLAGRLSGGMKQKLGLACALIRKPRLLLLDEPSVGVDPVSRRELWALVQGLADGATTVIWSTAYLDEAELCPEVILLDAGRILYAGPPGDLTARVTGRSFRVRGGDNRRRLLARARADDLVQDGIVQGDSLRLVLHEAVPPEELARRLGEGVTAAPVPPRFEDAYVDILGGSPGGGSPLAATMAPRPLDGAVTVEATGLSKSFGSFAAVSDVSFAIRRGEIFGLLGPNGAGKSTTFKMMCGLLRPSRGSGRVAGFDLRHAPGRVRGSLGYMAQKFSLYGDLSVRQNLEFFAGVYGLSGAALRERAGVMIDTFALAPHLSVSARDLPLGFKQRLALACALLHEPPVLFLDEPTSGVDPLTRREFWNHINALVEGGVTVLVTTHFMDEAEYCDRIGLIYRGELIVSGPPDRLKEGVRSPELPEPTLEDAFVALLRDWDRRHGGGA